MAVDSEYVRDSAETQPSTIVSYPAYDEDAFAETYSQQQEIRQPGSFIFREIIETLLLTFLIFWVVNTITGRFRIEGSSMEPTMHEGQYVLINKLAYFLDEPQRGDIVVLHFPRDPSRDFIKRIIGVPGDHIEIENNIVIVNGEPLDEPYIKAPPNYPGNWDVPEGEFFVLGDNRNNSHDSHSFGFVPRFQLVGKGWVVYWPFSDMERVPHNDHDNVPEPSITSNSDTGIALTAPD